MGTSISRPDGHVGDAIRDGARRGGQQPFLTFYDLATGERTELSHLTWENWVAKTANLLVEELDLRSGDRLAVRLPTSWTTAVVVGAAWRAGLIVDLAGSAASSAAAAVGEHGRDTDAEPDRVVVVGTGMAGRLTTDPGDGIGFAEEVLAFGDDFADPGFAPTVPALSAPAGQVVRTWSHSDLLADAAGRAAELGLRPADRLLSAAPLSTADGLITGILTPLSVGGSVVLVVHAAPAQLDAIAADERCRAVVRA